MSCLLLTLLLLQASEEVNLQQIPEAKRLGVITDRQESSAIGLAQSWSDADSVS